MKIDIDYLKEKLRTLDKDALLALRRVLMDPCNKVKEIKKARDAVRKGIQIGAEEAAKKIKEHPISDEERAQLESRNMFAEIKLYDIVDNITKRNVKEIIEEIDKILF